MSAVIDVERYALIAAKRINHLTSSDIINLRQAVRVLLADRRKMEVAVALAAKPHDPWQNELCVCGHYRTTHLTGLFGTSFTQECGQAECDCPQWAFSGSLGDDPPYIWAQFGAPEPPKADQR